MMDSSASRPSSSPYVSTNPYSPAIQRGRRIKRWYYIDMQMALDTNGDREEAVISLPEERQIKRFGRDIVKDYSTPEREYEAMLFPLSKVSTPGIGE